MKTFMLVLVSILFGCFLGLGQTPDTDTLSLKAVIDILHERQYWSGFDKSTMRDAPLEVVARGAVLDACYTLRLCNTLHAKMQSEVLEERYL